ncbi:MAG: hypothetical protein J0I75_21380, partial [Hyphomicrobium sp.]|nr:hypothetical protein [Hyphomicrobium sp.]
MPTHQGRKRGDFFRRFLQQQKIRLIGTNQLRHILGFGAYAPQQIPARDAKAAGNFAMSVTVRHGSRHLEKTPFLI